MARLLGYSYEIAGDSVEYFGRGKEKKSSGSLKNGTRVYKEVSYSSN
jgi:hypothetical protein